MNTIIKTRAETSATENPTSAALRDLGSVIDSLEKNIAELETRLHLVLEEADKDPNEKNGPPAPSKIPNLISYERSKIEVIIGKVDSITKRLLV